MSSEVRIFGNPVTAQFSLFLPFLPPQGSKHTFLPLGRRREGRGKGGMERGSKEEAAVSLCSQCRSVLKLELCIFVPLPPGYPLQKHKVHKVIEYYHSPFVMLKFSVLINLKVTLNSSLCPHPRLGSMHGNQASGVYFYTRYANASLFTQMLHR